MVSPPTLVADYESSTWFGSSPVNINGVSAALGDVLVANFIDWSESAGTETIAFANTGTAQTWTSYTPTSGTADSDVYIQQASAVVSAALSGVTVSETQTVTFSDAPGGSVQRFSGSDGIGASARKTGAGGNAPSVAITTLYDNSAIVYVCADWSASVAPTPVHNTVNGFTPTVGNGGQLTYANDATWGTVIVGYIPDAGAAGSKTVGIAANGDWLISAVEVRGTGASRISYAIPASGNHLNTTTPKTTTAFDVVAGDLIVMYAGSESDDAVFSTPTASGGAVAWTARDAEGGGTASFAGVRVWTGVVGSTATGITVSVANTGFARNYGIEATVWRNAGGVGVTGKARGDGLPSATLSGMAVGSAVQVMSKDWNGVNGATRTWRTVNGAPMTENSGGYVYDATNGSTMYSGYRLDNGANTTATVGLTLPAAQHYSTLGIEILSANAGLPPAQDPGTMHQYIDMFAMATKRKTKRI